MDFRRELLVVPDLSAPTELRRLTVYLHVKDSEMLNENEQLAVFHALDGVPVPNDGRWYQLSAYLRATPSGTTSASIVLKPVNEDICGATGPYLGDGTCAKEIGHKAPHQSQNAGGEWLVRWNL